MPDSRIGVFLIHGLTGSPTEMSSLEKALRRVGYKTTVPLLAGHGAGYKELLATTWEDWREGLQYHLRAFAETCDEVVIVGLCVGGLLGLMIAADEDKVTAVVSLAPDLNCRVPGLGTPWARFLLPVVYRVPWLMRMGYWTQKPPYGIKNPKLQRRIAKAVAESVNGQTKDFGTFRVYAGTFLQLHRLQEAAKQTLPRVKCPTLIIHSFEDTIFSIHNSALVYTLLGSAQKTVTFITGCDHVLTVDLRKDEVARRITRFIGELHLIPVEGAEEDGDFFTCEIAPQSPAAHKLVVRSGETVRLTLPLPEEGGQIQSSLTAGTVESRPELELAGAAIDALAFGLRARKAILRGSGPLRKG